MRLRAARLRAESVNVAFALPVEEAVKDRAASFMLRLVEPIRTRFVLRSETLPLLRLVAVKRYVKRPDFAMRRLFGDVPKDAVRPVAGGAGGLVVAPGVVVVAPGVVAPELPPACWTATEPPDVLRPRTLSRIAGAPANLRRAPSRGARRRPRDRSPRPRRAR